MSSSSRIDAGYRSLAAALAFAGVLGGCSDIYYDRRETIALGADDHIAANRVEQMIDPWPVYVGDENIAFSGERMQAAVECYWRNARPYVPIYPNTTALAQMAAQAAAPTTCPPVQPPTQAAPAAAVK
jgi:hypothetical protein